MPITQPLSTYEERLLRNVCMGPNWKETRQQVLGGRDLGPKIAYLREQFEIARSKPIKS